jgi:hypothetical protein
MIIVRLLSPEPVGWLWHHQLYSGVGADIVMESIALIDPGAVGSKTILPRKSVPDSTSVVGRKFEA